jgi:hypothetical protein
MKKKFNELLFVISAIIFNLAVSGVYIASKIDSSVLLKIFGGVVVDKDYQGRGFGQN